jgi:predicted PurR-regulated permease PerM
MKPEGQTATPVLAGARPRGSATVVIAVLLTVGALYVARSVLIPLALAVLIAFVLSPVLGRMERRLGRGPAVALLAVTTLGLLGALGWGVGRQVNDLARDLPQHRERLRQRIGELRRTTTPPAVSELQRVMEDVVAGLSAQGRADRPGPLMVVVEPSSLRADLSPAAVIRWATGAALTALLALFILVERQELRNRVIRLAGFARLPLATRALDDASRRIATYLLTQIVVNSAFGAAVGIGLALIGVPYALVWGLLAALLRFIPFLGFWAALGVAVAASLTASAGWTVPLLVVGLFGGLGVVLMAGVEPHLYSRTAGVSRVALLVAVMTLGWLWGTAGLLLATPITVCLVVLGRYLPEMKGIALVLGDEPVLAPHLMYYQRLLAGDRDEAAEVVEAFLEGHSPERLLDALVLPALSALKRDRLRGAVTTADQDRVLHATRRIIGERLTPASDDALAPPGAASGQRPSVTPRDGRPSSTSEAAVGGSIERPGRLIGVAVDDPIDELALELFGDLTRDDGCTFTMLSSQLLSAEVVQAVERDRPGVVCIAAVPPGGVAQMRHLVKRLRARVPGLMIILGRWGGDGHVEDTTASVLAAGAQAVGTTLAQSRRQLLPLLQLETPGAPALETVPREAA